MKHRCQVLRPDGSGSAWPDGLVGLGPLAEVVLSAPITKIEDLPNTRQVSIKMMIDTGAQRTVVDRGIADALGLVPIRFDVMVGVSHVPENCPVYMMSVTIGVGDDMGPAPHLVSFTSEIIGMSSPPSPRPFSGLLGRDFLRHGRLSYDGRAGYCDLIFDVPGQPRPGLGPRGPDKKDKRKAAKQARRRNRGR